MVPELSELSQNRFVVLHGGGAVKSSPAFAPARSQTACAGRAQLTRQITRSFPRSLQRRAEIGMRRRSTKPRACSRAGFFVVPFLPPMPREWGVIPMTGSIKGLLVRASCIGQFDLANTAGVYDYLPDGLAVLLTKRMLELVKPGGEFLFANFSTEVIPAGHMETFMNWSLIFRDKAQVRKIARATLGDGDEMDIFFGENRHIVYARIRKA
jgi:hypothetical protein